jgi:hypothetical protein
VKPFRRYRPYAGSNLHAGGQPILNIVWCAWLAEILVQQILKDCTGTLEAIRADICQIIRDDIKIELLSLETGLRSPK